jgi:hypothetical protein
MREWRKKNPDYVKKELENIKERFKTDLEYKEKNKQRALDRYYRLKAEKLANQQIIESC